MSELESRYGVDIKALSDCIRISGTAEGVDLAANTVLAFISLIREGHSIDETTANYVSDNITSPDGISGAFDLTVCYTYRGKPVRTKTLGQKKYIEAVSENEIVFAMGPAGTGKTYLAMAMAVAAFKKGDVERIVLVRPAVEAGERLGFLLGDLKEKVDPYLRPLYDALYDIMGMDSVNRALERGTIEVAPLAYMRGRTLDSSYIILDEAQNTTPEQMKMFLTRLGFGSKAIVTGDTTQIDLPFKEKSGLVVVEKILEGVRGIRFVKLTKTDVVRNPIVQRIIDAYEKYSETDR
ncbi:MAG: PhoH family protein [Eubacteriaceae bacterium]|nr:PhoH family protein [Eubacteriaceae bacterium]